MHNHRMIVMGEHTGERLLRHAKCCRLRRHTRRNTMSGIKTSRAQRITQRTGRVCQLMIDVDIAERSVQRLLKRLFIPFGIK